VFFVIRVIEKSPSDRAGLREGDIIQKLTADRPKELLKYKGVRAAEVGAVLEMKNRKGEIKILKVNLGVFPVDRDGMGNFDRRKTYLFSPVESRGSATDQPSLSCIRCSIWRGNSLSSSRS